MDIFIYEVHIIYKSMSSLKLHAAMQASAYWDIVKIGFALH